MRERDPFDEFLLHCASDMEPMRLPASPESLTPLFCIECGQELKPSYAFCPNCGSRSLVPEAADNPYGLPKRDSGQLFEVTILGISQDVTPSDSSGEWSDASDSDEDLPRPACTEVRLRLVNRTTERLLVSLTFGNSVLIDATQRQYLPVARDEEDPDGFCDRWFHLYPLTHVEGTLLFPEIAERLGQLYLSVQPQDRPEELFHFIFPPAA